MADEVGVRGDKLLERRIDRAEINIGDEAVDAGVAAGGRGSMQVAVRGHEVRQNPQIREPARIGSGRSKAADTLVMIALRIEFSSLAQTLFRQARMLPAHRVAEGRPKLRVLPTRVGHDPIEIVEHARDQMVHVALCGGKPVIDGQTVFADEVRDDRVAVADRLAVVDDVGKLPAGGGRSVEDVLMREWHASQFEESEYFEAVAVVVGDAEKLRV